MACAADGRSRGRALTALGGIAWGVTSLVALGEGLWFVRAETGGRAREVGLSWLLHSAAGLFDAPVLARAPAFAQRFTRFEDAADSAEFLALAVVWNAILATLVASALAPIWLRSRGAGAWIAGPPIAAFLFFLLPGVLHAEFDMALIGSYSDSVGRRVAASVAVFGIAGVALVQRFGGRESARRLFEGIGIAGCGAAVAALLIGWTARSMTSAAQVPTTRDLLRDSRPPNLLLISIDSLRADHLGAYGYPRDTSPSFDALAREGVLFETLVSSSSWTLPAHMTLLTSLPQFRHGVTVPTARLHESVPTLAMVLRRAGFETAGFVAGPFMRAEFGFSRGFDHYDDYSATLPGRSVVAGVTSARSIASLQDWLRGWDDAGRVRPFFVLLHLWDVHYDYVPPAPFDTLFDPDYAGSQDGRNFHTDDAVHPGMNRRDLAHIVALYDGEIRSTDEHLGRLVLFLRELGVLDASVLAVTADHGDAFFEHGEKGHRNSLYDELVRVPLLIRHPPQIPAGRRIAGQARMIDVAPTLLSLLGVTPRDDFGYAAADPRHAAMDLAGVVTSKDPTRAPQLSALSQLDDRLIALRSGQNKIIRRLDDPHGVEVYDLVADPAESVNLAAYRPELTRRLNAELEAFVGTGPAFSSESIRSDPSLEESLRALGYVE